jgi:hypothetical protein
MRRSLVDGGGPADGVGEFVHPAGEFLAQALQHFEALLLGRKRTVELIDGVFLIRQAGFQIGESLLAHGRSCVVARAFGPVP